MSWEKNIVKLIPNKNDAMEYGLLFFLVWMVWLFHAIDGIDGAMYWWISEYREYIW